MLKHSDSYRLRQIGFRGRRKSINVLSSKPDEPDQSVRLVDYGVSLSTTKTDNEDQIQLTKLTKSVTFSEAPFVFIDDKNKNLNNSKTKRKSSFKENLRKAGYNLKGNLVRKSASFSHCDQNTRSLSMSSVLDQFDKILDFNCNMDRQGKMHEKIAEEGEEESDEFKNIIKITEVSDANVEPNQNLIDEVQTMQSNLVTCGSERDDSRASSRASIHGYIPCLQEPFVYWDLPDHQQGGLIDRPRRANYSIRRLCNTSKRVSNILRPSLSVNSTVGDRLVSWGNESIGVGTLVTLPDTQQSTSRKRRSRSFASKFMLFSRCRQCVE